MLDTYQWLASPAGDLVFAQIKRWRQEGHEVTTIAKRLRKSLTNEQARLALEIDDLRTRSRVKFPNGERLWLTRIGLEQSTSEPIARYKASRFSDLPCHDLCCGIGGDLMSLCDGRSTTGWDRDPVTAWAAARNLATALAEAPHRAAAGMDSRVIAAVVPNPQELVGATWHLDPDRRHDAQRTTTLDRFSPSIDYIDALISACPHGALKVAPATGVPEPWQAMAEREWIGEGRECKQQVLWFGDTARRVGQTAATVVEVIAGETVCETVTNAEHPPVAVRNGIDAFLYEPHPTVLAAGLRDALAHEFGMRPLAAGHVLLTADRPRHSRLFSTFQVLEQTDLNRKRIHQMLDRFDVGEIELKPHGFEPHDRWRRFTVPKREGHRRTLWLLRIGAHYSAVLTQRMKPEAASPRPST